MGPIAVFLIITAVLIVLKELRRKKRGVEKQEEAPRWKWEIQQGLIEERLFHHSPTLCCLCSMCEGAYGEDEEDEPSELPKKITL